MSTETQEYVAPVAKEFSAADVASIEERIGAIDMGDAGPDLSDLGEPPKEGEEVTPPASKEWFEEGTPAEDEDDPETKAKLDALELAEPWRVKRLNRESQKRQEADQRAAAAEQRAAAVEAELQKYRAGTPPQAPTGPQAQTPEQMEAWIVQNVPEARKAQMDLESVKEENFRTVGEFNRAYLTAQRALDRTVDRVTVGISQQMATETAQAQAVAQTAQSQAQAYFAKVEKSIIPNFPKYLDGFRQVAPRLHDVILQAVTQSDEPDIATAAIMSSKANFDYFEAASKNPAKIPAALARLGALTEAYKAQAKTKAAPAAEQTPPKAPTGAPQVPRGDGSGSGGRAYHEKLRQRIGAVEYVKGVMAGKYPDLNGIK